MEQEIREALEKATPGPWKLGPGCIYTKPHGIVKPVCVTPTKENNAHLIANAPTYLEWCLSQIAELRKENEDIKYDVGMMHYELKQLDPILEMPSRGFVRNGYNSIVRMAAKWSED